MVGKLKISEKAFMNQVIQLATIRGWKIYHTYNSIRSVPGYPDLTLARAKRLIFAELKTETGKTTQAQEEWLGTLCSVSGIEVYLWRPANWPEIEEKLK